MNILLGKITFAHTHIRMFDYAKAVKRVASRVIFLTVKKETHAINGYFFVQHKWLYYGKLNQFRALAVPWAGSTSTARGFARENVFAVLRTTRKTFLPDIFLSPNLTSPDFGLQESSHQSSSCRTLSIKNEDPG